MIATPAPDPAPHSGVHHVVVRNWDYTRAAYDQYGRRVGSYHCFVRSDGTRCTVRLNFRLALPAPPSTR